MRFAPLNSIPRAVLHAGLPAALLALAGCAGPSAQPEPISSGLNALSSGQELTLGPASLDPVAPDLTAAQQAALSERAATDLQAIFDAIEPSRSGTTLASPATPAASPTPEPTQPTPDVEHDGGAGLATLAGESGTDIATAEEAATEAITGAPPSTPTDPTAALASKVAALLRTPAEGASVPREKDPAAAASALAALESLAPGLLQQLASASGTTHDALSEEDRATLLSSAELVRAQPAKAGPAVNKALAQALSRMGGTMPLRIPRTALCTRVLGFGRFETFATDTFLAGQPIRAIVYTEVDGFAYRAAKEGDPVQRNLPLAEQQTVELSQRLSLYHDQSGLLAWHRPAQKVVETTRNQRRDFFLIHQIELPKTLGVGTYILKVTVDDATNGSSTEASIPIKVVAERSR
jgi:hypothetical protein